MKFDNLFESDEERRRRERRAMSGDLYDVGKAYRDLRRSRPKRDLTGEIDPEAVDKLRSMRWDVLTNPETSDRADDLDYARESERESGAAIMSLIQDFEQLPLSSFNDEEMACTKCGSDNLVDFFAPLGWPVGRRPGLTSLPEHGIAIRCVACGHLMFFKPDNWPPKGHQDEQGRWVWAEADLNRRKAERAFAASGDEEDIARAYAQARRERGPSEFRGKIDPGDEKRAGTVEYLKSFQNPRWSDDPYAHRLSGNLRHKRRSENQYGQELADIALNAEHLPLLELPALDDDMICTKCGSHRVIEMLAPSGVPYPTPEFDTLPYESGVIVRCNTCDHRMFFRPSNWPMKGHRDEAGEWVWAEGFVPLVADEALLFEAGMSRRDFLKFLGKGAAAAYGAPLGKLDLKDLEKLGKLNNVPVRIDFFPNDFQKEDKLSDRLADVTGLFNIAKRLLGGDLYSDYDYGQYNLYQKGNFNLADLVKKIGLEKLPPAVFSGKLDPETGKREKIRKDEGIWVADTPFGNIQVTELNKWNDLWGSEETIDVWENAKKVLNPIKNYWELTGKDVVRYINYDYRYPEDSPVELVRSEGEDYIDSKALKQLEESGVDINQVKKERQIELDQQEEDLQDSEAGARIRRRKVDRSQYREVGHEREGQLDPRSSRTAEPVGPFEDLLKASLEKLI